MQPGPLPHSLHPPVPVCGQSVRPFLRHHSRQAHALHREDRQATVTCRRWGTSPRVSALSTPPRLSRLQACLRAGLLGSTEHRSVGALTMPKPLCGSQLVHYMCIIKFVTIMFLIFLYYPFNVHEIFNHVLLISCMILMICIIIVILICQFILKIG